MKKRVTEGSEDNFKETQDKNPDFAMCHHCKCFLYHKNLIRCNYRSSLMGTPIVNRNHSDPMLYNESIYLDFISFLIILSNRSSQRKGL